jgi:hypothetical protein
VGNDLGSLNLRDANVANVFTDGETATLSLVCLRVLGLLYLSRQSREARRIGTIIRAVSMITRRDERDIVNAMGYLAYWKRPLIWADSRTGFITTPKAMRELKGSTDTLNLTVAGTLYFERLIMSITYFQEATISLSWPEPLVEPGSSYADINTRFRAMREALRAVQDLDAQEYERYSKGRNSVHADLPPPALISNRIIYGVARSAFRILEADRVARRGDANEILEWQNLLLMATNAEHRLMGETNAKLDELIATFETQVGHK